MVFLPASKEKYAFNALELSSILLTWKYKEQNYGTTTLYPYIPLEQTFGNLNLSCRKKGLPPLFFVSMSLNGGWGK